MVRIAVYIIGTVAGPRVLPLEAGALLATSLRFTSGHLRFTSGHLRAPADPLVLELAGDIEDDLGFLVEGTDTGLSRPHANADLIRDDVFVDAPLAGCPSADLVGNTASSPSTRLKSVHSAHVLTLARLPRFAFAAAFSGRTSTAGRTRAGHPSDGISDQRDR